MKDGLLYLISSSCRYFRLMEVEPPFDGSTKAQEQLGWSRSWPPIGVRRNGSEDHKARFAQNFESMGWKIQFR